MKNRQLNINEFNSCTNFIKSKAKSIPTEYISQLYYMFQRQLKIKFEKDCSNEEKATIEKGFEGFINEKAERLLLNFLKGKCGLSSNKHLVLDKDIELDPHFHLNSLFVNEFPDSKLILPNFDKAYAYLKDKIKTTYSWCYFWFDKDRYIQSIKTQMTKLTKITEAQTFNKIDTLKFGNKSIVPILGIHRNETNEDVTLYSRNYDVCGLEGKKYFSVERLFKHISEQNLMTRIHMGETIIPSIGREHVDKLLEEAQQFYKSKIPLRIGHGTHASIDAMHKIAESGYFVEQAYRVIRKRPLLIKDLIIL